MTTHTKLFTPLILAIKRGAITDTGVFEAIASTYGAPADEANDIIVPGAFDAALAYHRERDTAPAMLWNHDTAEPIGKWISLTSTSEGLIARGKITLETRRGQEAKALLDDSAIAFSIGFSCGPGGTETQNGIRYIKTISRLYEISFVAIPCNPRAQLKKPATVKELERALREVGLSVREAKRVTVGGWYGFAREERSELELMREEMNLTNQRLAEIKLSLEQKHAN